MNLYKHCADFLVPLQKSWNYGITLCPKSATIHVTLNNDLMIQVIIRGEKIVSNLHIRANSQDIAEVLQFAQDYQRAAFLMQGLQAFNPNPLLQSP